MKPSLLCDSLENNSIVILLSKRQCPSFAHKKIVKYFKKTASVFILMKFSVFINH